MTGPTCEAAVFLRTAGPVRMPFRPCCAAVFLYAARASDSPPPPCPRRGDPLGVAVIGDLLFAVPVGTGDACPTTVGGGAEVIP